MSEPVLSLYEFNQLIKEAIDISFPETYMITAEIASIRLDNRGHCYLELVEKDESKIIAQTGARIWASTYKVISKEFMEATGINLSKGIKILIRSALNYHERYGLNLIINDIDASYTIGEMARKRKEVLERLTSEGIIRKNKDVLLPPVIQKIAVVSSRGAAGYEDFINQLKNNPYNYRFSVKLYEAIMQGDYAESSILNALSRCRDNKDFLDIVVIVRGGGASFELDCFDSYELGREIAFMPLPVISGIGHERDRTVIDEVSHTSMKTPTAVATFIINSTRLFEDTIDDLKHRMILAVRDLREQYTKDLHNLSKLLETSTKSILIKNIITVENFKSILFKSKRIIHRQRSEVNRVTEKFRLLVLRDIKSLKHNIEGLLSSLLYTRKMFFSRQKEFLGKNEEVIRLLSPENIMKRGYSITSKDGEILKADDHIFEGNIIETRLYKGRIKSKVLDKKQ